MFLLPSCFLFFSRLLCFSWSCFLFLLVFWWPSSASASVSVLAACNVFSDALPLLETGVGGFLLLLALHAFKYFSPSPSLKLSFWHWFSGTLPQVPWGRRIFSSLLFLWIFRWNTVWFNFIDGQGMLQSLWHKASQNMGYLAWVGKYVYICVNPMRMLAVFDRIYLILFNLILLNPSLFPLNVILFGRIWSCLISIWSYLFLLDFEWFCWSYLMLFDVVLSWLILLDIVWSCLFFASYLIDSPHLTCIFAIVCFAPQELRRPNRSRLVQKEKEFFRNPLTETRVVQSHPGRGLAGLGWFRSLGVQLFAWLRIHDDHCEPKTKCLVVLFLETFVVYFYPFVSFCILLSFLYIFVILCTWNPSDSKLRRFTRSQVQLEPVSSPSGSPSRSSKSRRSLAPWQDTIKGQK